MCTDRDYFQHFKQLTVTAHNTHVWLMLLFLLNMAQQTCLDAMVFVFLQALDFLHQSNYIKNGDSIPLWFTWSSIAHGCATILDEVSLQIQLSTMQNYASNYAPFPFMFCCCALRMLPSFSQDLQFLRDEGWLEGGFGFHPWWLMMTDPVVFFPLYTGAVIDIQLTEGC